MSKAKGKTKKSVKDFKEEKFFIVSICEAVIKFLGYISFRKLVVLIFRPKDEGDFNEKWVIGLFLISILILLFSNVIIQFQWISNIVILQAFLEFLVLLFTKLKRFYLIHFQYLVIMLEAINEL